MEKGVTAILKISGGGGLPLPPLPKDEQHAFWQSGLRGISYRMNDVILFVARVSANE